jgi:hypothetical protein
MNDYVHVCHLILCCLKITDQAPPLLKYRAIETCFKLSYLFLANFRKSNVIWTIKYQQLFSHRSSSMKKFQTGTHFKAIENDNFSILMNLLAIYLFL